MILDIQNVSKYYGKTRALSEFTAQLTPGVYGFLGPNGAGKSTLMNIITDNLAADSGTITFNGKDTVKMGKKFRDLIGYMPQQQGLYDFFTGRRFLWYMASLKGIRKDVAKERIDKLLEIVNLKSDANRRIGGYSGGMKQRLLIAQALLNDPDILILDEPTAGLDPKERIRIRNFISEIAAGKIVILATHVVSDIEFIAKEVMIIKNGQLIQMDTIPNLLNLIQDKVYEVYVPENELAEVQSRYKVSNVIQDRFGICARIVSGEKPEEYKCRAVTPHLEDLYIYLFD
ncbi:MAG: ABC transporter ATP-binding protein [Oscillospiraceae bacterium]|nr:ABC transporter ATP-binding protein [Oscillospiraceae bacterium]